MAEVSLQALVEALRRLPGVGQKSASRMAFHLLQHDREGARILARALEQAATNVRHCALCHTFTEDEVCSTCRSPQRDRSKLCVVETPADQAAVLGSISQISPQIARLRAATPLAALDNVRIELAEPGAPELEGLHIYGKVTEACPESPLEVLVRFTSVPPGIRAFIERQMGES